MTKEKQNKKKSLQRWKLYKISSEKLEKLNKYCPKCGQGTYLAKHKTRESCGKCGYTEFLT